MKKKDVGIWIRVSTEDQVKGESPEHHEKRARSYADSKDWNIVTTYHLEAVSGKSVMEHPEAKRMLKDIKEGRITGLIFSKLARLARNTRELLDFADMFKAFDADLISLQESIDTSTPAGRLFYTMIAAMAQWEREEIASRVAASVPVRASMGKPLGGAAPYGYRWEDKELVLDPIESPIRKEMYSLFLKHKRKQTVSETLNKKGYRTRNGSKFTDTTILRLLRDPIAKGLRRANYTKSRGEKKHWDIKPESEWVFIPCPAIIPEELWNQVNDILDEQERALTPRTKTTVHLFSGILHCNCGEKMYVPSRTTKYQCRKCRSRTIDKNDMEEIYFEYLKSFLLSKSDLKTFQNRANEAIQNKEKELQTAKLEKERVKKEMDKLIKLHLNDQIPTDSFKEYFEPLDTRNKQLIESISTIQGQLDYAKVQALNGGHILDNADTLYEKWPTLDLTVKRQIVEELTESIMIENEDITIKFGYNPIILPIIFQNTPKGPHNPAPAAILITPKRSAYVHQAWCRNI
jgi:site-specific DNA recombinase